MLGVFAQYTVTVVLFERVDKATIKWLGNSSSIGWQEQNFDIADGWYPMDTAIVKDQANVSSLSHQSRVPFQEKIMKNRSCHPCNF